MRAPALAALLLCLSATAHAKPARYSVPQEFNGDRWQHVAAGAGASNQVARSQTAEPRKAHQRTRQRQRGPVPIPRPRPFIAPGHTASLAGIVAPLAEKAREITEACRAKVISGVRHTYIRGTGGRLSLHASGRAVDIAGSPACIYLHLRGWPGGYSTDYARVAHVHISYAPGGPEWGVRFTHYRSARRHKHRRRT